MNQIKKDECQHGNYPPFCFQCNNQTKEEWEETNQFEYRFFESILNDFKNKKINYSDAIEKLSVHAKEAEQRVIEEWMNKYETDVDLTAKQVERRVARDITKEIDTFISQWLRNYANIPLKKRRDAFYEVADLRKVLLSKLDTNNINE